MICSSYDYFHEEVKFIQSVLLANGYPLNFIENCINRYLNKRYSEKVNTDPVAGPEKKKVFMKLPYLGLDSVKIKIQLHRLVSCVSPWVDLKIVFIPAFQLTKLSKLKCNFPLTTMSNVVYKITCADCSEFYIGKTERRLGQRIKEHMSCDNSALRKHSVQTGHRIDFQSASVLACDNLSTRLLIKESLLIKEQMAYKSLNGNVGSFELKLF